MQKMRAFSMMLSRGVVISDENATAIDISRLMETHNIGAVVIMRGEKLVGIVSERDIVRRVISNGLSPHQAKAKDFMTTKVFTAEFKDGLDSIYQTLCHSTFRHLPITDKGKLVGIASQRDVLYGLVAKEKKAD